MFMAHDATSLMSIMNHKLIGTAKKHQVEKFIKRIFLKLPIFLKFSFTLKIPFHQIPFHQILYFPLRITTL